MTRAELKARLRSFARAWEAVDLQELDRYARTAARVELVDQHADTFFQRITEVHGGAEIKEQGNPAGAGADGGTAAAAGSRRVHDARRDSIPRARDGAAHTSSPEAQREGGTQGASSSSEGGQ